MNDEREGLIIHGAKVALLPDTLGDVFDSTRLMLHVFNYCLYHERQVRKTQHPYHSLKVNAAHEASPDSVCLNETHRMNHTVRLDK